MTKVMNQYYRGLSMLIMFSLPSYKRKACGSGEVPLETFTRYLTDKDPADRDVIANEITNNFNTMAPYLKTIADILGTYPFSVPTAKMYCLGIGSLSVLKHRVLDPLLSEFEKRGLHEIALGNFTYYSPKPIIPFHTYHVILNDFITTGKEGGDINGVNNCMVKSGIVSDVSEDCTRVEVLTIELEKIDNKYSIKPLITWVDADPYLLGKNLKEGDKVAIHLGWVFHILNEKEYSIMTRRNKNVVEMFNN